MAELRAKLERAVSLLGVPGIVGFGLLLFSVGLYESAIAPGAKELAALRAQIGALAPRGAAASQGDAGASLGEFRAFFPPQSSLPARLDRIYALAEKEGLDMPRGEYRLVRGSRDPVTAYQAVFPVRGTYEQIRRFVAAVLNEMPFVSLDDLRLEKQRSVDQVVDSQIRMTLYLRVAR